jgi:hypothetical protein
MIVAVRKRHVEKAEQLIRRSGVNPIRIGRVIDVVRGGKRVIWR